MSDTALRERIDLLLGAQLQGVLATSQQTRPYTSLMAFAHTRDLRQLVFATYRKTQKHANLLAHREVSFLVDNRCNAPQDYEEAVAISVVGLAETVPLSDPYDLRALFLRKHVGLRMFIEDPLCALMQIEVAHYRVISCFQTIELFDPCHSTPMADAAPVLAS